MEISIPCFKIFVFWVSKIAHVYQYWHPNMQLQRLRSQCLGAKRRSKWLIRSPFVNKNIIICVKISIVSSAQSAFSLWSKILAPLNIKPKSATNKYSWISPCLGVQSGGHLCKKTYFYKMSILRAARLIVAPRIVHE